MALSDDKGLNLFGLNIKKVKGAEDKSAAVGLPLPDDGSVITASSGAAGAYYGVYMDIDGSVKNDVQSILQYRSIALYPEIDIAIQDIVNESIPHEDDTSQIEILLDDLDISDNLKAKITDEFETVLEKLNYGEFSSDIFRRWYIDGRMFYQIIVDKKNIKNGIVDLIPIDSTKIRKVKEIKKEKTPSGVNAISEVEEYYIYNEAGFGKTSGANIATTGQSVSSQGVKISPDAIVYCPSGYYDNTNQRASSTVLSYLQKAIRPVNQLRMLEDATIIYTISRAPERRIFYVDVGNLPKMKAEQYVKDLMNKYRNKMVYDAKSGEVRDDKKYMSMLEDFWLPRRDGSKGTEISTLPGAQNINGQIEILDTFKNKVYEALNVPMSRMQGEEGFQLGRSTEITRDELKFQKFIDKLRRKFSVLFYELLKRQLILKGIINNIEWEDISQKIRFRFQTDNFFAELKEQEVWNSRLMLLQSVDQYKGVYFSKEWIQKNVLHFTDDNIADIKEQIESEKDDPTAQPPMMGGMMQPGMDPSMMGGEQQGGYPEQEDDGYDPNDPYGQQRQNQF